MKEFCEKKGITVIARHGKRAWFGDLVKKDYEEAIKHYLDGTDIKYQAEEIMKKYGVECLRLPPYHPELTAIGKYSLN